MTRWDRPGRGFNGVVTLRVRLAWYVSRYGKVLAAEGEKESSSGTDALTTPRLSSRVARGASKGPTVSDDLPSRGMIGRRASTTASICTSGSLYDIHETLGRRSSTGGNGFNCTAAHAGHCATASGKRCDSRWGPVSKRLQSGRLPRSSTGPLSSAAQCRQWLFFTFTRSAL